VNNTGNSRAFTRTRSRGAPRARDKAGAHLWRHQDANALTAPPASGHCQAGGRVANTGATLALSMACSWREPAWAIANARQACAGASRNRHTRRGGLAGPRRASRAGVVAHRVMRDFAGPAS
jgi:hypothetical protein